MKSILILTTSIFVGILIGLISGYFNIPIWLGPIIAILISISLNIAIIHWW